MRGLLLLLLLLISIGLQAQTKAEDQVRAIFDGYRSAILNDRGEEAVFFLDENTFDYYDEMLAHIRLSDSATVAGLSLLDRMMVFTVRHRANSKQIADFNDTSLIVYAIDEGMVGKNGVVNLSLGEIEIVDDFASGEVLNQGEITPLKFHFYQEDDEWGLDLTALFAVSEYAFRSVISESGMEEVEFIIMALEMASGDQVDQSRIWQPTGEKSEQKE